jgi:ubiquinone/menaquinone biosynthesis C-methylase UbiE
MFSTISAWFEVMKLVRARDISKELTDYYRALSVNVLRKEGLFDFLVTPRTIQDIADHFGYTDFEYLTKTLEAYANDEILIRERGKYKTNGMVNDFPIVAPKEFGPGILQAISDGSSAIPNRMRGRYTTFSDEMGTFNWDDSLRLQMYEQIRKAAFKFTDALKREGNFIDVGCGSGVGTAAIWSYYYNKGAFQSDNPVKIYGLEYDPNLKRIAEEEFAISAARFLDVDRDFIMALEEHHPIFVEGNAEELPFEDEFFDMVYTSQVIHWCNAEKATKDMMRVLKPGGLLFGTEAFSPTMDSYVELYILLNEGASGSINKEDFFRWATEAGAVEAKSVTPAGVFRVIKQS